MVPIIATTIHPIASIQIGYLYCFKIGNLLPAINIIESAKGNINPFTTEASFDYLKKINSMYFPGVDIFNQSQMSNLTYDERRSLVWRIYLLATSKMNDASFSESD